MRTRVYPRTREEIKNYAKSAWINIPEGGRWRYEVENLSEGFEYFPQIAVVAKGETLTPTDNK